MDRDDGGEAISLAVHSSTKVCELQEMIHRATGILTTRQRLMVEEGSQAGKRISTYHDLAHLSFYDIQSGYILSVSMTMVICESRSKHVCPL